MIDLDIYGSNFFDSDTCVVLFISVLLSVLMECDFEH